jgi:bifunctional polynucleotide phosphatase/kinase
MFPTGGLPATLLENEWQFVRNTGEPEGEKCCMFKFMSGANVLPNVPLRIAAFDMDWTVIQPSSGKKHPVDEHDWELLKKGPTQVVTKFRQLHAQGYAIVLISNQGALASRQAEEALQRKVAKVIDALGVPATYMCGMSKMSLMRKPCTGMWDLAAKFYQHRYGTAAVDLSRSTSGSFYCGDAAGRLKTKHVFEKKDFANTDYTFALNVGCRFFTPEHLFFESKLDVHKVLPKPMHAVRHLLGAAAVSADANSTVPPVIAAAAVEIVLLFAPAACGKSTMCARYFPAHVRVNQDTLGSLKRCHEEARTVLEDGRGVVVDNTNLRGDARKGWRDLGSELGCPVRVVVLDGVNRSLSAHLAVLRQLSPELEDRPISNMVLASHYKDYVSNKAGLESEGYARVTHVPFSLIDHGPDLQRRLLRAFLPAPPSGFSSS